jgi:hypothetical protein
MCGVDLLTDIQAAAVGPGHSVSDLLRKCQILAFRLKHEPFKTWVTHELNGYPNEAELPPYRSSMRGELKANLVGPFGSSATNMQVPLSLIPEEVREQATRFDFYQGVAMLESLASQAETGEGSMVQSPFPVDLAARLEILQGYQTMQMWLEVPVSAVVGILDQIRTRALTFALEIEAENPAAGQQMVDVAARSDPPIPLARTDAIFQTVIFGGNVAVGPDASVEVSVAPGDLDSLLRFLKAQGVEKGDRDKLAEAIEGDDAEGRPKDGPGKRVASWLGSMSLKLAASGGRIGEGAVGGLIAAAVARYLGLG